MKRLAVPVLAFGALAACSDRGSVGPLVDDVAGTYRLAAYDGQPLPAPAGSVIDGVSRQLLAGSLVLNLDGTCSLSETVVRSEGGRSSTEVSLSECLYQDHGAGRLDVQFVSGSGPAFVQSVSYGDNSVVYLDFYHAREYRRVRP